MPQGEQGQQGSSSSMDFLWGVLFVVALCVIIWLTGKEAIIRGIITVKTFEIDIIQKISYSPVLAAYKKQMAFYYQYPLKVTFPQMMLWLRTVNQSFNFIFGGLLLMLGGVLYFTHPLHKFCRTFDMKGLLKEEKKYWPQTTPVSELDLVNTKITEGPWAMSMGPMAFAKKYNLLREERKKEEFPLFPGDNVTVKVRRDAARHVFTHQLGSPWEGPDKLPPHTRALLAIFLARANRNRKPADKLLKQIAASSDGKSKKLNLSGADMLLRQLKTCPVMKSVEERHAYTLTVMATMLELARADGVLASADFLWLKPIDRPLWYMLNCVGRRTAFCEIAGPWSHWIAEKKLGRALITPMVEEAATGLEKAIANIIYVPDAPETKGKK